MGRAGPRRLSRPRADPGAFDLAHAARVAARVHLCREARPRSGRGAGRWPAHLHSIPNSVRLRGLAAVRVGDDPAPSGSRVRRRLAVMVRFMVFMAWVGCTSAHPALTQDAPRTDPGVCKANLEAMLDRLCATPSECVLVDSMDCCGTIKLAVRAGTEGAFSGAEAMYAACLACPPLGCNHQDQAEDGSPAASGQAIVPTCVASRCKSVVQ